MGIFSRQKISIRDIDDEWLNSIMSDDIDLATYKKSINKRILSLLELYKRVDKRVKSLEKHGRN